MVTSLAVGLLITRLAVGLGLAAHGAQKLFGWFGGYGLNGTGGFFESLGFRPGRAFAFAAGAAEFGGGLLVALGFLGAVGPMVVLATMLVATLTVHRPNGFFATNNGFELPYVYTAAVLTFAFGGFGPLSLDASLGISATSQPAVVWSLVALGIIGGLLNLAVRRPPVPAGSSPSAAA